MLRKTIEQAITLDFETHPIKMRPEYPPKPVGVAIAWPGEKPVYYTNGAIVREVQRVFAAGKPILCHNALFDIDVAETHCGVKADWSLVHDTIPMLFIRDPYAPSYALKTIAPTIIKCKVQERDAVIEWLVERYTPVPGMKLSAKKGKRYAGAYICKAPAELVGPYACADVDMTRKLALHVAKQLDRGDMVRAYERERALLPVILEMERHGVRVDVEALSRDAACYEAALGRVDKWLKRKVGPINIDSDRELAQALVDKGLADETKLGRTEKTHRLRADKKSLEKAVTDRQVLNILRYRGAVGTCLKTFIRPWLAQASRHGRVFTRWNATRNEKGGARTGRMSSSPNLQNIPKAFKPLFSCWEPDLQKAKKLPKCPLVGLPDVPRVRSYILPDDGHILIDRDFSSQELRVLAHYEDDVMAAAYVANPDLDLHQKVADDVGISRSDAKGVQFSLLYGAGAKKLAESLGRSVEEAADIRARYFKTYPSVSWLVQDIKKQSRRGEPIKTWGGRQYLCEPPKRVEGEVRTYDYRLLNYLIQGSSADLTKDTMIAFDKVRGEAHLLASVHDEILVSCPKETWEQTMAILKQVMDRDLLSVPMRSTGKVGSTWATMKEVK